jgi:phosphatidylserine/phosphatidylglycerophosphate/cardiolipin synthase-like enzyme
MLVLALGLSSCLSLRSPESFSALRFEDVVVRRGPHGVRLLESGWEALGARVHLVRSARRTVELQTFIWGDDEAGRLMAYELIQAARRGVHVRLLVDQMFSSSDPDLVAFLATADPGLELRHYNPNLERISSSLLALLAETAVNFDQVNHRAHDKVMVVDGEVALIGGRNLENSYFDLAEGANYYDREILVRGGVVEDVVASFDRFWDFELSLPSAELRDVGELIRSGEVPRFQTIDEFAIADLYREVDALASSDSIRALVTEGLDVVEAVAFCCDQPGKPADRAGDVVPNLVTRTLGGLARDAERSILIQSPYLVLSERSVGLFRELREEHPEISVRISTNSLAATDSWQTYAMSYRQKRTMLEDLGLRIHEFQPRPADLPQMLAHREVLAPWTGPDPTLCLHSKSVVFDGEVAGVGSFNLDPRSGNLNTEVMLLVFDRDFAERLTESIETDAHPRNSWTVWKRNRPLGLRQVEDLADTLSSLVGSVTTLDLWPSRYATSFELREGHQAVPPGHHAFYDSYRDVGHFPGVGSTDEKWILTRLFKALGSSTTPIL